MMNAAFTEAVRYELDATCVTPLRAGSSDGNPEEVLRRKDGQMFLQGTSLAGAMREWISRHYGVKQASALMGCQEKNGHLMVSDGVFAAGTEMVIRPRLRIDGATGSAADGGKFNVAHTAAGSRFSFTLTWLGCQECMEEVELVEEVLSVMEAGEICLGAQKTNGFGRVSLKVRKRAFDLEQEQDREAWLSDEPGGQAITLKKLKNSDAVTFEVHAYVPRILVKSEAAVEDSEGSCTANLTENGKPVIPGSSIKGPVLSRAKSIAALLHVPTEVTDLAFGRAAEADDNGIAGCVRFEDALIEKNKPQKITRIRIDRFTGGVIRGGLFREEPVSGELTLRITAPADQPEACALLLLALRDLGLGLYGLGSGGAVGRGILKVREITAAAGDETLSLTFGSAGACKTEDPDALWKRWAEALGGVCDEA